MIRASLSSESGDVLALGVSKENVNRLLAGSPIRVSGVSVGQPHISAILIFYGETEDTMESDLRKAGLIGPETITVRDIKT